MTRAEKLVEEHLDCVRWTIGCYISVNESVCGLEYDDLYQEGCIALWRASESFDESQGVLFRTYAVSVIRNHLVDYCRKIKCRTLPTVPLDHMETACGMEGDDDSRLFVEQVLAYGKRTYGGVARMGIEALELKIAGYSGTDIAALYGAKPNEIGAWISRAAKKLKRDVFIVDETRGDTYKKVS